MSPARRVSTNWFWVAVAVSLVASLTPWADILLYPFKLFTTWVHECGHAVAAVLVGGRVMSITIQPDTSGLTQSLVPSTRLARGFVASAGYLGAAMVGCLLMAATRVEKWAHIILLGVGVCMLVTVLLWMRNLFGVAAVVAWGVDAHHAGAAARHGERRAIPPQPARDPGGAQLRLRHSRPVPD